MAKTEKKPKGLDDSRRHRYVDDDLDGVVLGNPAEKIRVSAVRPAPAAGKLSGSPDGAAEREDLRRWRKVALKGVVTRHREPWVFESKAIRPGLFKALQEWLAEAKTTEDVEWAFRSLAKARRPLVSARRRIRLERKFRAASNAHFREVAPDVARLAVGYYGSGKMKAVQVPDRSPAARDAGTGFVKLSGGPTDEEIDAAMNWPAYVDSIRPTLAESFLEGETLATEASGVEIAFGLTDEQARDYAENRAAELVGKRVLPGGAVVENPNAKWAISKATREKLRAKIAQAFDEGWTEAELQRAIESPTFWTWRSDMIARTEVAVALNKGTVQTYGNAGVESVQIVDGPGCLEDGHDDAERGVSGETWPIEKFDEYPIGHPNCRRDAIPIVPEE